LIKIAILGAASIAKRSVAPNLVAEHGFELVHVGYRSGVNSDSYGRACELAETHRAAVVPVDKILEGVDAIYIPYPPSLHKEWLVRAIESGVHVWCEKPLTTSHSDTSEVINLARSNGVVVLENYMFLEHNQHVLAKKLAQEIGGIRLFRAAFAFPPFKDAENFRYREDMGGGALLDCAGYPIRAAMSWLGDDLRVVSASLSGGNDIHTRGVDIYGSATLQSSKGITAQIHFGFDNSYECMYAVHGSSGILSVPKAYTPRPADCPIVRVDSGGKTIDYPADPQDHFLENQLLFRRLIDGDTPALEASYSGTINAARIQQEIREIAIR
jgi:dTDP-3,4-didehydro-2,6-dideoxy-alpha-D-glucose 3-reductase